LLDSLLQERTKMSEKGKGFVLTPSRLGGKSGSDDNGSTKPKFTGLKQSKLGGSVGILADSKLSSLSSQSNVSLKEGEKSATTFRFTPLTKPSTDDAENTAVMFNNTDAPPSLSPTTTTNPSNTTIPSNPASLFTNTAKPTAAAAATAAKTESSADQQKSSSVFGQNLSSKVVLPEDKSGSIFGQNLSEKAIVPDKAENEEENATTEKTTEKETSELLFSSVSATPKLPEEEQKTLSESAAEYTESHTNKRKYDEVAVFTGEEEESNVLQSFVKLHIFDTEKKNWMERGRGLIRLNDAPVSCPGHIQSRLVMRTQGSLRVILNTKLWADMVCEKVNDKNLRISAWDEDVIKIFLLTASQPDAEKLFKALQCRVKELKLSKDEEGEPSAKKKPEEPETEKPEPGGEQEEPAE